MNSVNKTNHVLNRFRRSLLKPFKLFRGEQNGFRGGRAQVDLDKKLVFSLAKSRWPSLSQLKYLKKYLNRTERLVIGVCLIVILSSGLFLGVNFYRNHLRTVAADGGDYTEGVVGAINYVNPLYSAVSDVDSDLTSLIFSSLFKRGTSAELVNDLAESYQAGADGKTYTVKIKNNIKWHNGSPLTADDLVFTFQAIKNPDYKSPLRSRFTGVEIEKIDDQSVKFSLAEPYAAFPDLLNFGILPQELWQQIEPVSASLAELNLKPVGSGPFKFKSLVKDKSGNIRSYNLVKNPDYYGQPAHLDSITFKLFGNTTELVAALNGSQVDGIGYLPEPEKTQVAAQDSLNFYRLNMPKLSAVFFNTKNQPILADKKVRQALAYAIDKNKLIAEVENGDAQPIDSPILPGSFAYDPTLKKYDFNQATSTRLLAEAGWKAVEIKAADLSQAQADLAAAKDEAVKKQAEAKIAMGEGRWLIKNNNYLVIELTTVDNEEYGRAAGLIAEFWRQVNVKTRLNLVPSSQIQSDVIRPRNFSALFYSAMAGADPDPYAFWHSSQIGQAGLNIADYANKEADKLLEDGRLTSDFKVRKEKYDKFQQILIEDEPAIFLYSPAYLYLQSKNIKGLGVKTVILPSDRFADVNSWYVKTGKKIVW